MAGIKVCIVEDEMLIAQNIMYALAAYGYETPPPAISYTEALEMMERERPDIVMIDIQLSGRKDGIELAGKIKELYNIPFIFLTANADAATVIRAKQVMPAAYLLKPFTKEELFTAIEVCLHNFSAANLQNAVAAQDNYLVKEYLFIKQGQLFHKIRIDDILYVEADNVYIDVYTSTQKFMVRSSIQVYLELLDCADFFRVHRSYAVNIKHIDTINSEYIMIKDVKIPISKAYREELLGLFKVG